MRIFLENMTNGVRMMGDTIPSGWGDDRGAAGFAALIAVPPDGPSRDAVAAIALAGGRVARELDWDAITDAVALHAGDPIVILDARGVADAVLATILPQIDGIARGRGTMLIAALVEDQIDIVAAGLIGSQAQLLCAPSMAEWLAAVFVARELRGATHVHDPLREGETARLARLNEEVARIAEVLTRLSTRETQTSEAVGNALGDRRTIFQEQPVEAPAVRADQVRQAIRARRLRDRFFGHGLFEDPAWDMILDLYAAHLERAQVSVSSLCIAAAVAPTTALRWIGKLTEAGLFERHADPFDRRRAYMALSPRTLSGMHGYVAAVREGWLTIA